MNPKSKEKEKILIDEESEINDQWDVDVAIKEAISRVTRTKEAKRRACRNSLLASLLNNRQQQLLYQLPQR